MRFQTRPAPDGRTPEPQTRLIERAAKLTEVVVPRDWTSARIEAWLSWADGLPCDYPPGELPAGLTADRPFDPLLGAGPARWARRLAAWGWALGLFDASDDAEAFGRDLFALLARGAVSPDPRSPSGPVSIPWPTIRRGTRPSHFLISIRRISPLSRTESPEVSRPSAWPPSPTPSCAAKARRRRAPIRGRTSLWPAPLWPPAPLAFATPTSPTPSPWLATGPASARIWRHRGS